MSYVCLAIFDPIDGPFGIFHPGLAKNFASAIALEAHLSLSQTTVFSEAHQASDILSFPRLEMSAYTSLFALERSIEGILALVVHQSQEPLLNENRDVLKAVSSRIIAKLQVENNIKQVSRPLLLLLREWAQNPLTFSIRPEELQISEKTPYPPSPSRIEEISAPERLDVLRRPDEYFRIQRKKELDSLDKIQKTLQLITVYGEKIDSTVLTLLQLGELTEPITVKHLARSTMQNELLLKAWLQKLDRVGLISLNGDLIEPVKL